MTMPAKFICILFAAAAALPSAVAAQAETSRYLPLVTACPDVLKVLPDNLYPAWLALDSAAEVLVDFKVDGNKIRDVAVSGGHGSYVGPVRRAVKALKCQRAGEASYAVRFRIKFQYPEDEPTAAMAMQFSDEPPRMAVLRGGE